MILQKFIERTKQFEQFVAEIIGEIPKDQLDAAFSVNSSYNLPSVKNFDQLHQAVCKD